MRRSIDDALDDHPADDDERPPVSWVVALDDDCDACGDGRAPRRASRSRRPGRAGLGVVAHLAPDTARRLRAAIAVGAARDRRRPGTLTRTPLARRQTRWGCGVGGGATGGAAPGRRSALARATAVLGDLLDRDHRDAVLLREQLEERQAGGRAVVVQHLADDRDRGRGRRAGRGRPRPRCGRGARARHRGGPAAGTRDRADELARARRRGRWTGWIV